MSTGVDMKRGGRNGAINRVMWKQNELNTLQDQYRWYFMGGGERNGKEINPEYNSKS